MRAIVIVASIAMLAGCATDSGVVKMGADTYMVSKQAASGFSGMGSLKADAMKEAYAKCSQTGQAVAVVNTDQSKPPYILGNYPRIDVTFRCVAQ